MKRDCLRGIDEYEMSTALQNLGFTMTQEQAEGRTESTHPVWHDMALVVVVVV